MDEMNEDRYGAVVVLPTGEVVSGTREQVNARIAEYLGVVTFEVAYPIEPGSLRVLTLEEADAARTEDLDEDP